METTMVKTKLRKRTGRGKSAGLFEELILDSFAGGGGASMGIEAAIGRAVDVAVNHDREAVEMHTANHPQTRHYCEDVWSVDPREATGGRPVGIMWASPDCKHFSRAKGAKPVEKKIRALAWVVVKWAKLIKPRVIILENVREFEDWGPLVHVRDAHGKPLYTPVHEPVLMPDKTRKGLTFRRWVGNLRGLGYAVEWRSMNAADYGAPTNRRRLFLIARRDGKPIVWPKPTHGPGLKPYRTAAECIDWSIPCPSIFTRKRPLAEKTMRRIAMGLKRYVLENPKPFIVPVTHAGERRNHPIDEPMPVVTGANRGELAMVAPTIINVAHGERGRWGTGAASIETPLGTIHAGGKNHAVASAFLTEVGNTNGRGGYVRPVDVPNATQTSKAKDLLISAWLVKHFGGVVGQKIDAPQPTTTAVGTQNQIATAHLLKMYGTNNGNAVDEPLGTVTGQGLKFGLVYAFLCKYFGCGIGQTVDGPMHTVTTKDRFSVVTVTIAGQLYAIADIGMRMLTPRELARAQGFPDSYVMTGTKTSQVARIGNSVCPVMAEVLVKANLVDEQ